MVTIVLLALIGSAQATVIDLRQNPETENQYEPYVRIINNHPATKHVAKNYDKINIVIIDDNMSYSYVLDFDDTMLENIRVSDNETCDTQIIISRKNLNDLINNWDNMSSMEKIKFTFNKVDMPINDILTFGAIAISMR